MEAGFPWFVLLRVLRIHLDKSEARQKRIYLKVNIFIGLRESANTLANTAMSITKLHVHGESHSNRNLDDVIGDFV